MLSKEYIGTGIKQIVQNMRSCFIIITLKFIQHNLAIKYCQLVYFKQILLFKKDLTSFCTKIVPICHLKCWVIKISNVVLFTILWGTFSPISVKKFGVIETCVDLLTWLSTIIKTQVKRDFLEGFEIQFGYVWYSCNFYC